MSTLARRIEAFGSTLKDLVAALRDACIFLLFVMLLVTPATIKDRLIAAGFTKGSIAGFEWEGQLKAANEQTKAAGQTVSQANDNYTALIDKIERIEKSVSDPALKSEIRDVSASAETSRVQLATADAALKRTLLAQQQIAAQVAPEAVAKSGWVFLGKVTEDKQSWVAGVPQTVDRIDPTTLVGASLTVRDNVYLRADNPTGGRAISEVLSVAKVGDAIKVLDVDYSHAKGGGWFVWVKVNHE